MFRDHEIYHFPFVTDQLAELTATLQGPPGPPGKSRQGRPGPPGPQGLQGTTAYDIISRSIRSTYTNFRGTWKNGTARREGIPRATRTSRTARSAGASRRKRGQRRQGTGGRGIGRAGRTERTSGSTRKRRRRSARSARGERRTRTAWSVRVTNENKPTPLNKIENFRILQVNQARPGHRGHQEFATAAG